MIDLFKFNAGSDPSVLENGELVNGASEIMWTERYRTPGEFKIEAPLSSGLRSFLPLGTLVSHTDTLEVMIVETHSIKEDPDKDPILQISGRSLEAYFENRIVGSDLVWANANIVEYTLASAPVWSQAKTMLDEHIDMAWDTNDLGNFTVEVDPTTQAETQTEAVRSWRREPLDKAVLNLLAIENLGIRSIRRNTFGGEGNSNNTVFYIHSGEDHSATVIFSVKAGDLDSAEYLWSDMKRKTSAVVVGQYVNVAVHAPGAPTGFGRRYMFVDGSHLDGHLDVIPTGAARTTILAKMSDLGIATVRDQNRISLASADISELIKYQYRKDYQIGDIVMIDASYGQMRPMRVVEFTEIQDEQQIKGHPTLEDPYPELI